MWDWRYGIWRGANMTKRTTIKTDKAPKAVGPYSQAIVVGDLIFTAGQIPLDPETGKLIEGTFQDRVRQVLDNLDAILIKAGSSLSQAVKVTVFLTDLSRFGELNEVYGEYFSDEPPARSAVQVSQLPLGTDVEIECVALRSK